MYNSKLTNKSCIFFVFIHFFEVYELKHSSMFTEVDAVRDIESVIYFTKCCVLNSRSFLFIAEMGVCVCMMRQQHITLI
jgi:hypothetical protein